MRLIFSLLAILLTTAVNADPSKPSVADQIRHPRGQELAGGNCTTSLSVDRPPAGLQHALLLKFSSRVFRSKTLLRRTPWEGVFSIFERQASVRCRTSVHGGEPDQLYRNMKASDLV
jgi:hypothetical protein